MVNVLNSNEILKSFIDTIANIEHVSSNKNIGYKLAIRYYLFKLRRAVLPSISKAKEFSVSDLMNFTSLLKVLKKIGVHDNTIKITTDEQETALHINEYEIDMLFSSLVIQLWVCYKDRISLFTLTTKSDANNNTFFDMAIGSSDKSSSLSRNKSYKLSDRTSIQSDNKSDIEGSAFTALYNSFIIYYNKLFDGLERKYLK